MKKQRLTSSILALSMAISACSSSSNNSSANPMFSTQEEISKLGTSHEKWVQLTSTDHPNYALAEILAPWLWQLNPDVLMGIKQKASVINTDSSLNANLQNHLQSLKLGIILGDKSYIQDEKLLGFAVFSQVTQLESQGAFSLQIRLQTAAEAQAQAYLKVQNAFNEKVKQNARDIGSDVVAKLSPEAINQINNAKNKDPKLAIREIYQVLEKWDKTLSGYDFPPEDGHKLILYGYIATEIYDHLKDHSSVKEFVRVLDQVRSLNDKVKEVRLVLGAMDNYRESLSSSWKQMTSAMKDIQEKIDENPDWAVDLEKPLTDESKKKSIQLITDLMLGQSSANTDGKKRSVLSSAHPMSNDIRNFFDGAAKTANSVDGLISGTRTVANSLGIELDPKIEDALNTAQKISDGVKIAEQVASAFSSDGLMGAFSALAGSGGASLVMGPAGLGMAAMAQAQMNAELGKINKKLDEVIALQKQVLELQKQTLAKLDELSHKLDEYHNQEMLLMAGVKNEIIESRRGVLSLIDEKVNSCTSLVNRITSITGRNASSLNLFNANDVRENVADSLKSQETRTSLLKEDVTRASFAACSLALMNTFSGNEIQNTPLSARLRGNAKHATPFEINAELFAPALSMLNAAYKSKSVTNMALHLPTATFSGLAHKEIYMKRKIDSREKSLHSELNDLVSVDALERYSGVLLSLHPLLSISSDSWKSIPDVVESSWNGSKSWAQKQNLSEFWLRSALNTVNIAIAQQALLAGEPLLPQLVEKIDEIAQEPMSCEEVASTYCYVRKNQVMAKNLLRYYLFLRAVDSNFMGAYTKAHQQQSPKEMEKILGASFVGHITSNENKDLKWKAETNVSVDFPSPEEIQKGMIAYPSEIARLVKIQERIADELIKVSPNYLPREERQRLTELILFKGH